MSTTTSSPIQQYDAIRSSNKFILAVFYRGSWCPFCQAYLKELEKLSPQIHAANGQVLAITSEASPGLDKMRQTSGYTGVAIVDPENLLATELKRRGIIDVAISEHQGYPHGMVQPAVLVGGNGVDGILFRWAIVPSMMNLGGAKDRPVLTQVWDNVEAKMTGKSSVHAKLNTTTFGSGIWQKIFG